MAGDSLAYPLRVGTSIDRALFIDLLLRLERILPVSGYTYIGLAGPFLTDFHALVRTVGFERLISLEADESVLARQRRHCGFDAGTIQLSNADSSQFIDAFDRTSFECGVCCWLDYSRAREVAAQIAEAATLARLLEPGDILRVTLNAHLPALGHPERGEGAPTVAAHRRAVLARYFDQEGLQDLVTALEWDDSAFETRKFTGTVRAALKHHISHSLADTTLAARGVLDVEYADGHSMITTTFVIADDELERKLDELLANRAHLAAPMDLNLPYLSQSEAAALGRGDELGYSVNGISPSELSRRYAVLRRFYPHFARLSDQ